MNSQTTLRSPLAALILGLAGLAALIWAVQEATAGPTGSVLHVASGAYASTPDHTELDVGSDEGGDITVEAWVYLNPGSTKRAILGKESGTLGNSSFSMSINSSGYLVCSFVRLNGSTSNGLSRTVSW